MSKSRYLLDTSAILTFLVDEEGAERVEMLLRNEEVIVPFVVLLETHYISLQEQSEDVADRRYALLKQLPVTFLLEIDEPTLLTAARFKANHHITLADAMIAAYSVRQEAILVHKDPEFEAIGDAVRQETLPYKQ